MTKFGCSRSWVAEKVACCSILFRGAVDPLPVLRFFGNYRKIELLAQRPAYESPDAVSLSWWLPGSRECCAILVLNIATTCAVLFLFEAPYSSGLGDFLAPGRVLWRPWSAQRRESVRLRLLGRRGPDWVKGAFPAPNRPLVPPSSGHEAAVKTAKPIALALLLPHGNVLSTFDCEIRQLRISFAW